MKISPIEMINILFQNKKVTIEKWETHQIETMTPLQLQEITNLCGSSLNEGVISSLIDIEEYKKTNKIIVSTDDNQITYIVKDDITNIIQGLFIGYIDGDKLESGYTCAVRGIGELIRYYVLLSIHLQYPHILNLYGGISGGIPPIQDTDSQEIVLDKKKRLIQYHSKRGATITNINNLQFNYNYYNIIHRIKHIFYKYM